MCLCITALISRVYAYNSTLHLSLGRSVSRRMLHQQKNIETKLTNVGVCTMQNYATVVLRSITYVHCVQGGYI